MAFTTKALSFFYKRLGPTGSVPDPNYNTIGRLYHDGTDANNNQNWWISSSTYVSTSFLNFPTDGATIYLTTRDSGSNRGYRALPWGSPACDFLWNVQVPVWSYDIREVTLTNPPGAPIYSYVYNSTAYWTYTHNSQSFFKNNVVGGSSYGVSNYPITSSWKMIDAKLNSFEYIIAESSTYPAYPVGYAYVRSQPTSAVIPIGGFPGGYDASGDYAYDITYPNIVNNATSSIDKQYFDVGTGAGITQGDILDAADLQDAHSTINTANGLATFTQALKKRRLYFPVPISGSGTTGGTDYWFKTFTGYTATELFNENGGIYNVQFTLKKWVSGSNNYQPQDGSYLSAFIHNVIPQAPSSSARIPGADGWYPPENNIVRIGNGWNGTPVLSFYDPQTGYLVEKFNFNLIQYGYPAQFCLEPSTYVSPAELSPPDFGIIVSDIEMCKIGVTTDPKFIKPTTVNQTVINQTTGGTVVSDPYIPPAP